MKIEYKGYIVTQNDVNHHTMISKNGKMVAHAPCKKPMTIRELECFAAFMIEQSENFDKYWNEAKVANSGK